MSSLIILLSDENEVNDINNKLSTDGFRDDLSDEHKLRCIWRLYKRAERSLSSSVEDINKLRKQQADDMTQVEEYISHIQQLSDEQKQFIKDYEQENDMLKDEAESIKKVLEDSLALDKDANDSTFHKVESLVNKYKMLNESFDQLKIEKEILSETLSEHSSSFKEEIKLVDYLNKDTGCLDGLSDMLKNTEPIEKIKILINIAQKQSQDLKQMNQDQTKLKECLLIHDKSFDIDHVIGILKFKDEKHQSLQKDLFALKETLINSSKTTSYSQNGLSDEEVYHSEIEEEFNTRHFIEITQRFQTLHQEVENLRNELTSIDSALNSFNTLYHQKSSPKAEKISSIKETMNKQSVAMKQQEKTISKMKSNLTTQEQELNDIRQLFGISMDENTESLSKNIERCLEVFTEKIDSSEREFNGIKEIVCHSSKNLTESLKMLIKEKNDLQQFVDELQKDVLLSGDERASAEHDDMLFSLKETKVKIAQYKSDEENIKCFVVENCESVNQNVDPKADYLQILFDKYNKVKQSEKSINEKYTKLDGEVKKCFNSTDVQNTGDLLQKYHDKMDNQLMEILELIKNSELLDDQSINIEDLKESVSCLIQNCKDRLADNDFEISNAKQLLHNNMQSTEGVRLEETIQTFINKTNKVENVINDVLKQNGIIVNSQEEATFSIEQKLIILSERMNTLKNRLENAESEKLSFEKKEIQIKEKLDAICVPSIDFSQTDNILWKMELVKQYLFQIQSEVEEHQTCVNEVDDLCLHLINDEDESSDQNNNYNKAKQISNRFHILTGQYQKLKEDSLVLKKIEPKIEQLCGVDSTENTLENFDILADEYSKMLKNVAQKDEQLKSFERTFKDCHLKLKGIDWESESGISANNSMESKSNPVEISLEFLADVNKVADHLKRINRSIGNTDSKRLVRSSEECVQIIEEMVQEKQRFSKTLKKLDENTTLADNNVTSFIPDVNSFDDLVNAFLVLLRVYGEVKSRSETSQRALENLETKGVDMKSSLEHEKLECRNLSSNLEQLESSYQDSKLVIENLERENESLERQIEELSSKFNEIHESYESLLMEYNRCNSENESIQIIESEKAQLIEENEKQQYSIVILESERQRLNEELRLLKVVHGQISGTAKSLAHDLKSMKREHNEREENLQIKLEALELTLEDERNEFDQQQTELEKKVSSEQQKHNQLLEEMRMLREDMSSVQEDKDTLQLQVENLLKEIVAHDLMVNSLEEEHSMIFEKMVAEFEQRLLKKEKEIEFLGTEIITKNDELTDVKAAIEELETFEGERIKKEELEEANIYLRQQIKMKDGQLESLRTENIKIQNKITELKIQLKFTEEKLDKHKTTFENLKVKLRKRSMEIKLKVDSETSYRNQITHLQETNDIQTELLNQLKRELQELRDEHGHVMFQSQSLKRLADQESGRSKHVVIKASKVKSQNCELKNTLKEAIEELHQL